MVSPALFLLISLNVCMQTQGMTSQNSMEKINSPYNYIIFFLPTADHYFHLDNWKQSYMTAGKDDLLTDYVRYNLFNQ